jgi:biopolymer transport protein ExbD
MAINLGGMRNGRRGSRDIPALSEINVTPFVDVVLVLLIIFMITAHVMEYGIEIDVPKTKTVASSAKELPVVTLSKSGDLFLGSDMVNINALVDDIHRKFPGQQAVYVRADRETTYDPLAQVLARLGDARLGVNLVTQPDENAGKKR